MYETCGCSQCTSITNSSSLGMTRDDRLPCHYDESGHSKPSDEFLCLSKVEEINTTQEGQHNPGSIITPSLQHDGRTDGLDMA